MTLLHKQTMLLEDTARLPDSLFGLVRLAIADLKSISQNSFSPDSSVWFSKFKSGHCVGCLAGAVIYSRLFDRDVTRGKAVSITPSEILNSAVENKLYALDLFRRGNIVGALLTIYGTNEYKINLNKEDLYFLRHPINQGQFGNWDQLFAFLEWADLAADILEKYEIAASIDDVYKWNPNLSANLEVINEGD